MSSLQKILELIRSRNVEVTVTYEEASDSYLFRISKIDVPIKATVCFNLDCFCLEQGLLRGPTIRDVVENRIDKLEKLTAELHEIE